MTKTIFRREGFKAAPVDEDSLGVLLGFKDGSEFIADLRGARNIEQLRLFWALAAIVEESSDIARHVIKNDAAIALGFTNTWVGIDGRMHVDPASIAVESMTQAVFDQFFTKAVNLMATWISADHKDLMRRFNELAADKRYEGMRHG